MTTPFSGPEILPGRPVRLEPVAPGLWLTVLGVCLAALAPLVGFLVGVMSPRAGDDAVFDPIYWGLFGGIVVGGAGVLMAVLGGRRLWRHVRGGDRSAGSGQES